MQVYCPECENGCSPEAPSCPKCGHPLKVAADVNVVQLPPPTTRLEMPAEEELDDATLKAIREEVGEEAAPPDAHFHSLADRSSDGLLRRVSANKKRQSFLRRNAWWLCLAGGGYVVSLLIGIANSFGPSIDALAQQLAIIQEGGSPAAETVGMIRSLLLTIDEQCPNEPAQQIGDICVRTWQIVNENRILEMDLVSTMNGLRLASANGVCTTNSFSSISAGWLALVNEQ